MDDAVHLIVPSSPRYAATVRYVAMTMSAMADFDIDRVEDARLAVDEAFNALLSLDTPRIRCVIAPSDGGLHAEFRAVGALRDLPGTETFGWTVLRALVSSVDVTQDGPDVCITLHMHHETLPSP